MSDAIFNSLMNSVCTFEEMSQSAASGASYGHSRVTTTASKTFTGIRCRFSPMSVEEEQIQGTAGRAIGNFNLWLAYNDIPVALKNAEKMVTYRVKDIKTGDGTIINAGPFDINSISMPGGELHHWKLALRKVK